MDDGVEQAASSEAKKPHSHLSGDGLQSPWLPY